MDGVRAWAGVVAVTAFVSGCGITTIEPIASRDAGTDTTADAGDTGDPWAGTGGYGPCGAPESPRTGAQRQVRDMTGAEARAWCTKYVTERYPADHAEPPPPPYVGANYPTYIEGYGATWCWQLVPGGGCVTHPEIDDCVTNLLHAPCEATIAALDDCVDSFFNYDNGPADTCNPVGGGCAPFLSAAHCEETVIMTLSHQPPPDPPGSLYDKSPQCALRLTPECD